MSKDKTSSSTKRTVPDDYLTSYLNMKSPLMGHPQFDVSVLPPPVDPKFLDYEIGSDILNYELTGIELSERLSHFSDFSSGVSDPLVRGTSFTGCGIENKELMTSLESSYLEKLESKKDSGESYISILRDEVTSSMNLLESLKMGSSVNKAKELLPAYLQNLMSFNPEASFAKEKKVKYLRKEVSSLSTDSSTTSYEAWKNMTLDERVEVYMSELEKTFAQKHKLVNPNNKNIKISKVFEIIPNMVLWDNKYLQVGIDGVTVNSEPRSKLEVKGVLKVANETQTQRFYEYYRRVKKGQRDNSGMSTPIALDSQKEQINHDPMKMTMHRQYDSQKVLEDDFEDLFEETFENEVEMDQPTADPKNTPDKSPRETTPTEDKNSRNENDKSGQDEEGDLYNFIRQYTSQKISKTSGTENYYLLCLPENLEESPKVNEGESEKNEGEGKIIEIVPIRGPKLVFSKAGVTKRPDIRVEYVES